MLRRVQAALSRYFADRKPRYVGAMSFNALNVNPLLGLAYPSKERVSFFVSANGRRSVKVTSRGLRKQPLVLRFLHNGILPSGRAV